MLNAKGILLLLGALLLISSFCDAADNQLSPEDKRRIIKSMLQSQKDIRKALFRIRAQIQSGGDGNGPDDGDDGDDDDDDDDDDLYGGGEDGFESPENEEYYREQQQRIKEAREKLEIYVKNIASKFIEIHDLIEKMNDKVDKELQAANSEVNYNLYYKPNRPHHGPRPTRPRPTPTRPTPTHPTATYRPTSGGYYGRQSDWENPLRRTRGSRSLKGTIPTTVDTEQLASPDVPSVKAYDDPTQKVVQFQMNQQQVQT